MGSEYDHIELQPRYVLIPKFDNQRKTEYIADFALWKDNKLLEVIDVKGMPTEEVEAKDIQISKQKYHSHGYVKHLNTQGKSG